MVGDSRMLHPFQFQCGAIGRTTFSSLYYLNRRFNSSVVRLEEGGLRMYVGNTEFQFQCGAIGSSLDLSDAAIKPCFNSSVVRLEGCG